MLLKKQTVWLLTMLSLVVVLSVYYITSPEQKGSDIGSEMAGAEKQSGDKDAAVKGEENEVTTTESEDGNTVISGTASDEVFEALRLELNDQRSAMKEQLTKIAASTDLPVEKRNEAYDQIKQLDEMAVKEELLESLIKAMGYDDSLVRVDGGKVRITVKTSKEHTKAAANEIIREVSSEFGELQNVAVEFQPSK